MAVLSILIFGLGFSSRVFTDNSKADLMPHLANLFIKTCKPLHKNYLQFNTIYRQANLNDTIVLLIYF